MAKPHLLKNTNVILTWEELVPHIKKNHLIKFDSTLNCCEYYLIDTNPKSQIYLKALGGTLVKYGES